MAKLTFAFLPWAAAVMLGCADRTLSSSNPDITAHCLDPAGCQAPAGVDWSYYEDADCGGQEYALEFLNTWDGRGLLGKTPTYVTAYYKRTESGLCVSMSTPSGGSISGPMYNVYRAPADTGCHCEPCHTCVAGRCEALNSANSKPCTLPTCSSANASEVSYCQSGACVPAPSENCAAANGQCDPMFGECVGT